MTQAFQQALLHQQELFLEQLPSRVQLIQGMYDGLQGPAPDPATLADLHRRVHSLIGTAGTLGLQDVSGRARALEEALRDVIHQGWTAERWALVAARLAQLHCELPEAAGSSGWVLPPPPPARLTPASEPCLYLVEDDPAQAQRWSLQWVEAGYRVVWFESAAALRQAMAAPGADRPDVMVMDMVLPDGEDAGVRLMTELGLGAAQGVPVVFLTVRDDLTARLQAFRAGVSRYLLKSTDPVRVLDVLDEVSGRQPPDPFRVLLVDDDPLLLQWQEQVLCAAGFRVRALSSPLQVLEEVNTFDPDVLVLDVYMPEVSGPEIAAVLREREAQYQLPIVFLSGESDSRRQWGALGEGGDDFLLKPVEPAHFVTVLRMRARRARENAAVHKRLHTVLYEREREHLAVDEHAIVSITDAAGSILYVNDKFCQISGYPRDELLGKNHRLIKSGVHDIRFYEAMWNTISQGRVWRGEVCNRSRDGQLYWVESTITPFLDQAGRPYQYVSIRTDITRVKLAQAALQAQQERLDMLLTASPAVVYMLSGTAPHLPLYVSPNVKDLLGVEASECMTSLDFWRTRMHPEDRERAYHGLMLAFEQEEVRREYRFQCGDGTYHWLLDVLRAVRDEHGQVLYLVGSSSDINERKRAELLIEQQGNRLHRAQLYAHMGTWEWNIQTDELVCTDQVATLLGLPAGQVLAHAEDFMARMCSEDRDVFRRAMNDCVMLGVALDAELRVQWPDGSLHWLSLRGNMLSHSDGAPWLMLGVAQDIDKRKQDELALVQARNEAQQANRAKSEFLSSMSHELRTPMNAILGFGQLMEYDDNLTDEQRDHVHEILKAGRHLLELINEVLDLAKIESGRIDLSIEALTLDTVVQECLTLVQTLAHQRGIRVFGGDWGQVLVRADRTRLKQVLLNLLSNAVKYNREGGRVHIGMEPAAEAGHLRIWVRDTGWGIAADRMQELFQPFNRLDAENSGIEGTGIGLTITRRIVELMGGRVGVDSTVGEGSTFWIELPAILAPVPAPLVGGVTGPGNEPAGATAAPADHGTHLVLYIDDNPANLKLVTHMLANRPQWRLRTAHLPGLGLELALALKPDLILLDINMPDMDGYQVLSVLKTEPSLKHIPVVALTANAMPRDMERGKMAGFSEYLTKPLSMKRLLQVLDECLEAQGGRV